MMAMQRCNTIQANGRGFGRRSSSSTAATAVAHRHRQQWRAVRCRSSSTEAAATSAPASPAAAAALFADLDSAVVAYRKAPPSQKLDFSADVKAAFDALSAAGALPKWGSGADALPARRTIMVGELRQMGIKNPEQLAVPSTRNDAAFLGAVVLGFSVLAVVLGQLPGDWGFFSSYLTGGVVLAVLAVGSTAPGLLQGAIDAFSQVFPDYRARVLKHEAAHFLVGYLLGVPITGYSVAMTREHVEFAEAKLQARIFTRDLSEADASALAAVAVAGIAAEGMAYPEVMGQTADLMDLQRLLLRQRPPLSNAQQQSATRWAVWAAALLLRRYKAEHEALQAALAEGKSVAECCQVIEAAKGGEA